MALFENRNGSAKRQNLWQQIADKNDKSENDQSLDPIRDRRRDGVHENKRQNDQRNVDQRVSQEDHAENTSGVQHQFFKLLRDHRFAFPPAAHLKSVDRKEGCFHAGEKGRDTGQQGEYYTQSKQLLESTLYALIRVGGFPQCTEFSLRSAD